MFWNSPTHYVGIDIGSSAIKIACLKKDNNNILLNSSIIETQSDPTSKNPLLTNTTEITKKISALLKQHKIKPKKIGLAIPEHLVFTKKIYIPLTVSKHKLLNSVAELATTCIPYQLDEVSYDYQVLGVTEDLQIEILVAAAKSEVIDNYIMAFKKAGLNINLIELSCFALTNAFTFNYTSTKQQFIILVNIGAHNSEIVALQNGKFICSTEINLGTSLYIEAIADIFQIIIKEAELVFTGEVENRYDEILYQQTINNTTEHLATSIIEKIKKYINPYKLEDVDSIYVTGGGVKVNGLLRSFMNNSNLPCLHLYALKKIFDLHGKPITSEVGLSISPHISVATGTALHLAMQHGKNTLIKR